MATKTGTTKKPSGLYFTRDGAKIGFHWKISDADYGGGQQFQWGYYNNGKGSGWITVNIGVKTTDKTVTIDVSKYYPLDAKKTTLTKISFRVRGKRRNVTKDDVTTTYSWSDWVRKDLTMTVPQVPSVSQALDNELNNVTRFTWNTNVSTTDSHHFYNVEWQSVRVHNCTETDGSKIKWGSSRDGWMTGVGSRASSVTITEDSVLLSQGSYTRWFRVRARGWRGNSAWRYSKHVYAMPYCPTITSAKKTSETIMLWTRVRWKEENTPARPVDFTTVDYTIGVPQAGLQAPEDASWTTVQTIKDTGGADEVTFLANEGNPLPIDNVLWVRVAVQHDRNWRSTAAARVVCGKLTPPSGLSVESDSTTYQATVTATNNSEVPDSRLAIVFRKDKDKAIVVGVSSLGSGEKTVQVQCPNWSTASAVSFSVYAFRGSAQPKTSGGITTYAISAQMQSTELKDGGAVPIAPTGVTAEMTDTPGEVMLTWNWSWNNANRAEISWSQNPNAWESTDEPETYMISSMHAAKWRVSGLATGVTWYFCIRLAQANGDDITYGPYCDPVPVDLSSAPSVPTLMLSSAVIQEGGTFTASWAYSATDGTQQSYAEICEADVDLETEEDGTIIVVVSEDITYGEVIAHTRTAQHVSITAPDSWTEGSSHALCVRTTSASGRTSEWSSPIPITIAVPIECEITQTSLVEVTIGEGEDERTIMALQAMPLTATITGAGEGGTTTLIIERSQEYHVIRPDESVRDGFEGETVVLYRQTGDAQITIDNDSLIGLLDDGAPYRLIATVEDGLGQTASQEIEFEVHWTHQAEAPTATVEMVDNMTLITPVAPESVATGDVCDIYRLTADLPELIVEGGTFGETYVDPYPAIGRGFGHRIVDRTANGDYITEDNSPAWIDLDDTDGDLLDVDYGIIDFDGKSLQFLYNAAFSGTWSKDFEQTRYLGGSIVGDWNPGVSRSATINAVIPFDDAESFQILRRLAEYTGICHVRTQDGSSYSADVQVGDDLSYETAGKLVNVTLTITRIDPETLDGALYSEWINGLE